MREPEVKCVADACTYWVMGDRCGAGKIAIGCQDGRAGQPEETACETFRARSGISGVVQSLDNMNLQGMLTEPFARGQQLAPTINCEVANCRYWAEGDRCVAPGIEVAGRQASEHEETSCATFEE